MANIFDTIRENAGGTEKSVQWYQAQVRKLGQINTNQLLRQGTLKNKILPGEMYLFKYDPKTKEQMKYYDMFPLVLPFKRAQGGFLGINIHYLPYLMRMKMLRLLSDYATDVNMNEDTRIRYNWRILESSTKLAPAAACVKRYLLNNVQTRFLKIPFPDWVIASQLPVEKFIGEQKSNVWRDTRKMYT